MELSDRILAAIGEIRCVPQSCTYPCGTVRHLNELVYPETVTIRLAGDDLDELCDLDSRNRVWLPDVDQYEFFAELYSQHWDNGTLELKFDIVEA